MQKEASLVCRRQEAPFLSGGLSLSDLVSVRYDKRT